MSLRSFVVAAVLGVSVLVPAASFADEGAAKTVPCALRRHHVLSAEAYKVEERSGKVVVLRTRGAELYVAAEPGLTAEWLRSEVRRDVLAMQGGVSMPDCPLDADSLQVDVHSGGAGFVVRLIGRNATDGKEILRRAQLLVR